MMPDQILRSHGNGSPSSPNHFHANQSSWMSHWTRTPYQPRQLIKSHSSSFSEEEDAGRDKSSFQSRFKIPSDVYKSAKRMKTENEARTVEMTSESLKSRGKTFRDGELGVHPFFQDKEISLVSRAEQPGTTVDMRESIESSPPASPVQGEGNLQWHCNSQPQSSTSHRGKLVPSQLTVKHKGLAFCPSSGDDNPVGSPSHAMPDKELGQQFAKNSASSLDQGHYNPILVHEKAADYSNSISPMFKERCWALMQQGRNQYANSKYFPSLLTKTQSQGMQNRQETGFFPGQICPRDAAESENSDHGCHLLKRVPRPVSNVATMRICARVGSSEDSPQVDGPSKFFQTTTHHVLITRKTDINATSEERRVFGGQQKFKAFDGACEVSRNPMSNHRQGLKILSILSSSDSEEEENVGDAGQSDSDRKNESSAETDAMDLNAVWDKISGPAFRLHNEDIPGDQENETTSFDSQREQQPVDKFPATKIFDANKEHRGEKATSISQSKTQTMDADHLLYFSGPSSKPDPQVNPEPSSRWVKRLKLSSSNSLALCTSSSKAEETSSPERVNMIYNKISIRRQSNSNPKLGQDLLPPVTVGSNSQRYAEPSPMGLMKEPRNYNPMENQRMVLSQSWIRRWHPRKILTTQERRDRTPVESMVICEPQTLKAAATDEIKTKQFPSIAAMALMGKAMNGFRACQYSKRGPLVMWNTKKD